MAYEHENEIIHNLDFKRYEDEMNIVKTYVPYCKEIVKNMQHQDVSNPVKEYNVQEVIDLALKMYSDIKPEYAAILEEGIKNGKITFDNEDKRSFASGNKDNLTAQIHMKKDLKSIYTPVHEFAHYIASKKSNGGDSRLKEVESWFAEKVFGDYAVESGLITEEENEMHQASNAQYALGNAHRVLDETTIYDELKNSHSEINDNFVESMATKYGFSVEDVKNKISHTLQNYDKNDPNNTDGDRIENEARFVMGDIISTGLYETYKYDKEIGFDLYSTYIENKDKLNFKQATTMLGSSNLNVSTGNYIESNNTKTEKAKTK